MKPCPICGRSLEVERPEPSFPPFCSSRCRQVDLVNWLDGTYQPPWLLDPEELAAQEEEYDA